MAHRINEIQYLPGASYLLPGNALIRCVVHVGHGRFRAGPCLVGADLADESFALWSTDVAWADVAHIQGYPGGGQKVKTQGQSSQQGKGEAEEHRP